MTTPGSLFLIDTSALARATDATVRSIIEVQIAEGLAATCATIDFEVSFSTRSADEMRKSRAQRREYFVDLLLDEQVTLRALQVQQLLADKGLHRAAGVIDLLTAAVAETNGAVVLHYDADFEHIASITGQRHQWIVPRGSVS